MRAIAAGLVLLWAGSACSSIGPVARDPWVEDHSLELTREVLVLDVRADRVDVDAWFAFTPTSSPRAHTLSFVTGEPAGTVSHFIAVLVHGEGPASPVSSEPGEPTPLPMGPAGETRDLSLPAGAFAQAGTWLRVRYTQAARGHFSYVLRSGAYWSGSIRSLDVVVRDRGGRVLRAEVEGQLPRRNAGGELEWKLVDCEPKRNIELALR